MYSSDRALQVPFPIYTYLTQFTSRALRAPKAGSPLLTFSYHPNELHAPSTLGDIPLPLYIFPAHRHTNHMCH